VHVADLRQGIVIRDARLLFECPTEINGVHSHKQHAHVVAVATDAGGVAVADTSTGEVLSTIRDAHTNICSAACFCPYAEEEMVTGGMDGFVRFW
jgi:WD40 repeat protein